MKSESLNEWQELHIALKRGPAFLFLGQDYLRLESGADAFLSEVVRKYGPENDVSPHYNQIFQGEAQKSINSSLAWMQERCKRLSVPQWMKTVANFSWSGVYTSAIDTIWLRDFNSEWRELEPLFEEKYNPIDPRSKSRLHCTFLFGRVDQVEETTLPPLTIIESLARKQVAISLARRLPELITPLGVLAIEGYAGDNDWFNPEHLLPIIQHLNPGQVHIFSATPQLLQNHLISHLVKSKILVPHDESLAEYLLKGEKAGFIKLGRRLEEEEHGQRIQLGNEILTVPSQIWRQVSRSAMILDDTVLIAPPSLSEENRYQEFRNFLAQSGTRPQWFGYKRGFAFSRGFEEELRRAVNTRLNSKRQPRDVIILYGQTGTGKTVALGALAYQIRQERKYPVLFIERKSQRPINSDIDRFCQWAENQGSPSTLVIWDGMVEIEQYYDLLQYLTGRGRKVVLVGSCYRESIFQIESPGKNFIEAATVLSENEIKRFKKFINGFDSSLTSWIDQRVGQQYDETFLAALYRLLPPTRGQIQDGVVREMDVAEQEILRRAQEGELSPSWATTLGRALLEAGLPHETFFLTEQEIGGEKVDVLHNLTALVMVPGRFGLKIPLELLLRTLNREDYLNFVEILNRIDIIQWYDDESGNIEIGARTSLEARLIVESRLGGAKTEVDFVKQLLVEVKDSNGFVHNREVEFAVNLVRSMGPNAPDVNYFLPHYPVLSQALQELREKRGVQQPRLMLQEANLLREYVSNQTKQNQSGTSSDETQELLNKTEKVLCEALQKVESQHGTNELQSFIRVEWASTLGAKVKVLLDEKSLPEAIQLFQEAHNHLFKARALNPESYHSIDVLAWTTQDVLNSNDIDSSIRAEAIANILEIFATSEFEDFSLDQQERFNQRRMTIGQLLGREDLSEEAFQTLIKQGSKAGYCLKALEIVGKLPTEGILNESQQKRCCEAANYLEENREKIENDGRCLNLLLHLWWKAKTGKRIFHGDRQTVPFTQRDWQHCREILLKLMASSELYRTPRIKYLYGLSAFHLDDFLNAFQTFQEIEQDSGYVRGRRRILRSYLISTPEGEPKVFTGHVVSTDGKWGKVYVPELRRGIPFLPRNDFNRPDIQSGESLGEFHLALNFIGLIAEPISFLKQGNIDEQAISRSADV